MKNPRFNTLDKWLGWQESLHWKSVDLGLNRIREVAQRLQLLTLPFTVITVAGTNGKGSTVALLESMLMEAGYRVGSYTSPYLYRYNERIKLSSNSANNSSNKSVAEEADDALICAAFAAIDSARAAHGTNNTEGEEISLTYFEFATLAAIWIFHQKNIQIAILEVGMGGRLDAVNLWDNDVAIISSIGIDHVKWLGDNREDIGREKSGIMRRGKPVISGDPKPPRSISEQATEIGAILYQAGEDRLGKNQQEGSQTGKGFSWQVGETDWNLRVADCEWLNLPFPALKGDFQFNNAAVAISALYALRNKLKVSDAAIRAGLRQVKLLGRLEQVQTQPDIILDVAHNGHAASQLAKWLAEIAIQKTSQTPSQMPSQMPSQKVEQKKVQGKTYALFSMLDDKDINQVVKVMKPYIDRWFVSTLDDPRGIPTKELVRKMKGIDSDANSENLEIGADTDYLNADLETDIYIDAFDTLEVAWKNCKKELTKADKVIVFGSFLVLSQFKVIF